jgi:predicted porin
VQAGGSYVLNTLDTPVASSAGINNLVLNSANDYWTANGTVGLALDEKTDLQLQYTYYHADDYVNNSASSLPFGAGDEQQSFTATITRRITKALQVSLKYGFYRNRDKTSGGIDNYDAQLVYANMQYRF